MIGNVSGPEASDVAIEEIPLHGLAKAGGAAGGVNFPARIENERAAHRDVRLWYWTALLESNNIVRARNFVFNVGFGGVLLDALRFLVDGAKMIHEAAFLSAK